MKTTLLLLAVAGLAHSAVFRQPTHKTASVRAKLIRDGTYSDFLAQQHLARATSNAGAGQQSLMNFVDDLYTVDISIGTPPQNFTVKVDTFSTDLLVVDSICETRECNGTNGYQKRKYDLNTSHGVKELQGFWTINSKNVAGRYVIDVFTVAGLTNKEQGFGMAKNATETFGMQSIDGILGFAWPSNTLLQLPPPMWEMIDQLDAPLFTIWLDRKAKPQEATLGGLITYGALDNENCDAQVNYVPLSSQFYWQFPITRFAIGGKTLTSRVEAASDTSSAWMAAPNAAVSAIATATGAKFDSLNQMYTVPCTGTYPDMVFTIGGVDYSVPSSEYVVDLGLSGGKCALAVNELVGNGFGPDWLFGQAWIRSYCNVYDIGQRRIGFAKTRHTPQ